MVVSASTVDLAKGPPDLIRAAGLVNSREAGMYYTKPGRPYKAHKAGDFCRPGKYCTKSAIL